MTSPFFGELPAPVDRGLHRFTIFAGMGRAHPCGRVSSSATTVRLW